MRSHYITIHKTYLENMADKQTKDPAGKGWKYDVYFPHKAGARNDPKLVKVFLKFEWRGVGIYWALMEILRESSEYRYPAEDLDALAHTLSLKSDELVEILSLFVKVDLLKKEGGFYYSSGLLENMKKVHEKSEKARASANAKWNKRNTNALPTQSERNANGMQVKNSKVNPSLEGLSLLDNSPVSDKGGNAPHSDPLRGSSVPLPPEASEQIEKIFDLVSEKIADQQKEKLKRQLEAFHFRGITGGGLTGIQGLTGFRLRIRREFLLENKKFRPRDLEKMIAEYEPESPIA